MSAFEIVVTPTRLKQKKLVESREPTVVVMAPFSAKAIVQFEDVPVGKTAKRTLRVLNTSDDDIEVKVTKFINEEHNMTIDWFDKVVTAQGEVEMLLTWNPLSDIACKETLQLVDNRNFRKDVTIILKSKNIQTKKTTRKYPTLSTGVTKTTHVKTSLRLKSPTNSNKNRKASMHSHHTHINSLSSLKHTNVQHKKQQNKFTTTEKPIIKITHTSPLTERNSCNIETSRNMNIIATENNDDAKENISPLTPVSVMSIIDKLKFTPLTETHETHKKVENLSSLPTPVTYTQSISATTKLEDRIQPRRLVAIDFEETAEKDIALTPKNKSYDDMLKEQVVPNKTFDIKPSETFDLSVSEIIELTENDNSRLSFGMVLNKTTTISNAVPQRALEMIAEEDNSLGSPPKNASGTLQKTYSLQSDNTDSKDLKRDIKLIGTPLRKYSESMKDLTVKSPNPKLGIQGSMPNLNEMENIRSIEQNRYFFQNSCTNLRHPNAGQGMSVIHEQTTAMISQVKTSCDDSLNISNSSQTSLASQHDLLFNHSEILAQSSRFNIHEVGVKTSKFSPIGKNKDRAKKWGSVSLSHQKKDKQSESATDKQGSAKKRRSQELSFSDTTSVDSIPSQINRSKTNTDKLRISQISPPKRSRLDATNTSFQRPVAPTNASAGRNKSWNFTQPKKFKLSQTLSLVKKPVTPRKLAMEKPVKLYDSDLFLQTYINPDPFAATTTCDPFLASTMYLDERAVDRHQNDFKKWLNALVTIPADFDAECNAKIDVGKLFNEVRNKELILAPTKEEQSMHYLTKFRLESLRRAAVQLFLSEEMRTPCSKVAVYINKQAIRIRSDRNLHLDVVMQRYILELLLCFNPLWLRLGLEVVYGEKIHLHSNSDIVGLSTFILNRLFLDKFLEQKYSKAYTLSDEYAEHIKKFTLQKMLFLLLFLDKAKSKRIIKHNPCLFNKKSPHKETRDILLRFSSELLANIGDITRELKRLGYVLLHKQSYLDEFDYAFNNLAVDLRDGIRLTRVMEIILLRDDLTTQLRVPAISRLQRIFNVNLGLRALAEADFQLKGEITAADIVDGHREKTLSLLWQVIYKFRSPKFNAAAAVLQKWWRNSWLRVVINRRLRHKEELRREAAALKIQAAYRGHLTRKFVKVYRAERTTAVIILQKYARKLLAKKLVEKRIQLILLIQRWYRAQLLGRNDRQNFLHLRSCVIFLQRTYRRRLFAEKLLQAANEARLQYLQKRKAAAMYIEEKWIAYRLGKTQREEYLRYRKYIIMVQRRYRAKKSMQEQHNRYLQLRQSVIAIQRCFRNWILMKRTRTSYVQLRNAAINMQRRRRADMLMQQQRNAYLGQLTLIKLLQQRYRAKIAMRQCRERYIKLRQAAVTIQQRYRATIIAKQHVRAYQKTRQSILLIQRKLRATFLARRVRMEFFALQYHATLLQQTFRARKIMRKVHTEYQQLRHATIIIQRRYRALLEMRKQRQYYLRQLNAVLTIQTRFRAYKQMRYNRARYQGIMAAVLCLQSHVRGFLKMKREREHFLCVKSAVRLLQKKYRARQLMLKQVSMFQQQRAAAITIQRYYRSYVVVQQHKRQFAQQLNAIICLQRKFRAELLGRQVRREFIEKRVAIIKLQRRYRATLLMRNERATYICSRLRVINLQRRIRAHLLMRKERALFLRQREAAVCLQSWYRSVLVTRKIREQYLGTRRKIACIQQKWRATVESRLCRARFLYTISRIVLIQRTVRANIAMRRESSRYAKLKAAAICVQQRYRARLQMIQVRSQYLLIRSLIICIQRKYRARKVMTQKRQEYLALRNATVYVQQTYRGRNEMRKEQTRFQMLRRTTLQFQAYARGYLARRKFQSLMTPEMKDLLRRKKAARLIQRFWRGYRVRVRFHNTRILVIRKTIKELSECSNVINSVRAKVQDAVRLLRGRFSASEALHVLLRLDRLSRTVPHLLMAHSDFISTFCYGIMAQAIRSEVDKQLIEYCSRIILNLARYNSTTANTFQEGGLVTIAQMLLRWCDKDCEIFNTLCTLIWVFAHSPEKRQIIRDFMTTTDAIYMVRETKKLVARKEKMKQNVRNNVLLTRNNQKSFSSRALPSLEPDYGLIRTQPYTFISSVYAFDTILCKLGIDIF